MTVEVRDPQAWQRLAFEVVQRRNELRLTQAQVAARGGPSLPTVQAIEAARGTAYRERTLMALEEALGWKRGAVNVVLVEGRSVGPDFLLDRGGSTYVIEAKTNSPADAQSDPIIEAIRNDPSLLPESKEHLVNQLGLLRRVQPVMSQAPAPVQEDVSPRNQEEADFLAQGQADIDAQADLRVVPRD